MSAIGSAISDLSYAESDKSDYVSEDSRFIKFLSIIPQLGTWVRYIQESSLKREIDQTTLTPRLIRLITVKNEYIKRGVMRNMLIMSTIIANIALAILGGAPVIVCLGLAAINVTFYGAWASYHANRFEHNKQVINELKSTGYRPGIIVR